MPVNLPRPGFHGEDAAVAHYQAMSGLAMGALLLGIASPAAMLTPVLWLVPWCGAAIGGWALWRIARRAPALVGVKTAWLGLALSLVFAVAAPTDWVTYRMLLRREAREFTQVWFELLAQRQPQKAHHLSINPRFRWPLDEHLWGFYRESPRWREELENFANLPLVRTLVALGPDAHARYYGTVAQGPEESKDVVLMLYAVTYSDQAARKTFFVAVRAERQQAEPGRSEWQMVHADGGVHPDAISLE